MIDLSFLTEAEQEAILKVLHRDAELKKAEDQRIRHLQDEINDENELKYKSGQWFYEAKSKRHRDKIHGADLVRASIRKRKSPTTIAELSQSSKDKSQRRWVNSINQDLFIPPELYGVMESPDETEEDLKSSKTESNQSAKRVSFNSSNPDKDIMKNGTASPSKQRKNPFNSRGVIGETVLENEMPNQSPGAGRVNGQVGKRGDLMSSIYKYGVKLPYPSPIDDRQPSPEAEDDSTQRQPPVPKPRKLVINGQPPDRSNSSLQREDSLNSLNKPKGILKRRSSSSSTDSESIRIPQNAEPIKLVMPSLPILEAEQTPIFDNQVTSLENSPDRQKQVRFSENVLQKPPTPNPESYNVREIGEFGILDPTAYQNELDHESLGHPHYKESKPTQHSDVDYVNSTEVLRQNSSEENPSVSLTIQSPSDSTLMLDVEKKLEDPSQEVNVRGYETLEKSYPEINLDSADPVYAVVKKPPKSTSSDQEKDFDLDDALMEPRFLGQRGKIENTYQSEKSLEFGNSYGGAGKINYGSHYTTNQPGVCVSTSEDLFAPESASNVQTSYQELVDEPKLRTDDTDYFPKWRRSSTLENEDLLSQPRAVQEFPNVHSGEYGDNFVQQNSENSTRSKYSPAQYRPDTKYKSIFLRNPPEDEGRPVAPLSTVPIAQQMSLSSTPVTEGFQTEEMFLLENRESKDLPRSTNFKVMSLKERLHDSPREQMSNPSQFQSLKHFWNVEDKNRSKGDLDASPNRILADVLKRNKPVRVDLKQRNSKEIPSNDLSLPSSFDSLSEEEQTSQKVASWLAQTPTVYGAEQVDADENQVHPGEVVMENIERTQVDRNNQAEEFSSALQKLEEEALEAPKIADTRYLTSKAAQLSPIKQPSLLDQKKTSSVILRSSAEKERPSGFYERVVQISSTKSPAKETKIDVVSPAISSKQYQGQAVEESVERTVAPAKTANEFKIGFEKLMEEHQSMPNKSDDGHQEEDSRLPSQEQQPIEAEEIIEKSSTPKGHDHQEFMLALKKLETETSRSPTTEEEYEKPVTVSTLNTVRPLKSSFNLPSKQQELMEAEEMVNKSSIPQGNDHQEFISTLTKMETEASMSSITEDEYQQPETVSALNTVRPLKYSFQNSFQNLAEEDQSMPNKFDNHQAKEFNLPSKQQKLIEVEEMVEKSSVPEGNDQQEFILALKKLETENSTSSIIEEEHEQPEEVPTLNTVRPLKSSFQISFQKQVEDQSMPNKSDEHQEESKLLNQKQQLIETEEMIEKSSVPKDNDHQEFISALKKLETEASISPTIQEEYEQPKPVSSLNTVSPMKSSFKIGFEHIAPVKDETIVPPQILNVTYRVQSSPRYGEDTNEIEEVVEKSQVPSRKDEEDFSMELKKLELEATINDDRTEVEEAYEKPSITPTLQSIKDVSNVQNFEIPYFDTKNTPSTSPSMENRSDLEGPYAYRTGNSPEESEDTYMISKREKPGYTFDGKDKFPIEEETIEKTIFDTQENSGDYQKQLMCLEEEAAASVPGESEDLSIGETFPVSQAPTKEVFISKKVFSGDESKPTELLSSRGIPKDSSQPQLSAYKELAISSQSPSDLSGSFSGSAGNVLYKKPDTSSEVSNSNQGMDESDPILSALRRSTAKALNSNAVQEVSPTSTNESQLNNEKEDTLAPIQSSFPENAEKFKRMSQSVPAFLQDDTDGRETDSASESSFQIGRHKKSPSSLTNLSGSSGMASMSSVSGSVMSVYSGDFGNVDIKGGIEFSIDYVEQLKEFHIYIYQCKDLAAAEVKKQRSDPYVKAYLLPEKAKLGKRKTAVKKKTLNPVYNEILRYKIPKQSLQAQTLNLSVWHHDALGRNSFLGEVNLNLAEWDWNNTQRNWYPLEPRTPASGVGLENRGEMKLSLKYIPRSPSEASKKMNSTGEVHIWIKDCIQLPMLRENKINSFVKCTILPDTSRKSRQKTRAVDKTPNPIFNHTMVYDGFKEEDLREACVELTVWDHYKLSNHFLGGLRIGLGTGKSYGTAVNWMDSSHEESTIWEKMIASPNTWIEGLLPLRMFKMAKLAK